MPTRAARSRPKRNPKGIYVDGIGLHQCGLPMESRSGGNRTLSMGDNNHSIVVGDTQIVITTKILTVLSLYMEGFLGQVGRIHQLAVADQDLGTASFGGLRLVDNSGFEQVRMCFERVPAKDR